jgi:hypothetical protein
MASGAADTTKLSFFVNRDEEMNRFRDMLDKRRKKVMTVEGSAGMGKTWLMERMVHECSLRQLRIARVIVRDTRRDALFIMRTIRDDLGAPFFDQFTGIVSSTIASHPGVTINVNAPIIVAEGLKQEGQSEIKTIAGINVDAMAEYDIGKIAEGRLAQLTDAFVEGMRSAIGADQTIVFIDDCQKLTTEAEKWLKSELLFYAKEGKIANTMFVLLSRTTTELKDYDDIAQHESLKPLTQSHIARYLEIRKIDDPTGGIAEAILVMTGGQSILVAQNVERILQKRARANE